MPALSEAMFAAQASSKANWESPVKLHELFPNANMCYQINKATKDANREIRTARLASAGRERNETFPSRLCPHVFFAESEMQICMFLFEASVLEVFTRNWGPFGSVGIHHAFSFSNRHIFFRGLLFGKAVIRRKGVGNWGDV